MEALSKGPKLIPEGRSMTQHQDSNRPHEEQEAVLEH